MWTSASDGIVVAVLADDVVVLSVLRAGQHSYDVRQSGEMLANAETLHEMEALLAKMGTGNCRDSSVRFRPSGITIQTRTSAEPVAHDRAPY